MCNLWKCKTWTCTFISGASCKHLIRGWSGSLEHCWGNKICYIHFLFTWFLLWKQDKTCCLLSILINSKERLIAGCIEWIEGANWHMLIRSSHVCWTAAPNIQEIRKADKTGENALFKCTCAQGPNEGLLENITICTAKWKYVTPLQSVQILEG